MISTSLFGLLQTDASGSLEAVRNALSGLPQDSVVLRYLMATPNDITVSDIDLAAASKGLVLGFNVEPSETVLAAAKHQGQSRIHYPCEAIMGAFPHCEPLRAADLCYATKGCKAVAMRLCGSLNTMHMPLVTFFCMSQNPDCSHFCRKFSFYSFAPHSMKLRVIHMTFGGIAEGCCCDCYGHALMTEEITHNAIITSNILSWLQETVSWLCKKRPHTMYTKVDLYSSSYNYVCLILRFVDGGNLNIAYA